MMVGGCCLYFLEFLCCGSYSDNIILILINVEFLLY